MLTRRLHHDVASGHAPETILKTSDVALNFLAHHFNRFHALEFDSQWRFHGILLI
jgi:hypothetical protein